MNRAVDLQQSDSHTLETVGSPELKQSKPTLLERLKRYRDLGQLSTKLSYENVRGPDGYHEDTDRLLQKKHGKRQLPVGHKTASQLSSINDRERALLRHYDMEYYRLLQKTLESKRSRVLALKRIILPGEKKILSAVSGTNPAPEVVQIKKEEEKKPVLDTEKIPVTGEMTPLFLTLETALLKQAELTALKDQNDTSPAKLKAHKIQSPKILLLKSRITALNHSIVGESYAVKGGIPNLQSPPLCFALAARHLQRYIEHLKHTRKSVALEVKNLKIDIEFERRLLSELKLISHICKARSFTNITKDSTNLTLSSVIRLINKKKSDAEQEASRLMGCLKYVIQAHLAPYLCLYSHKVPAISTQKDYANSVASNSHKKQKKGVDAVANHSKFSISNQLQPVYDIDDSSDINQVSIRLQSLLTTLLNQSLSSSSEKVLYTQIKSLNDPIVRLLLACDVIVRPPHDPHLIHLRAFGISCDDSISIMTSS